MSRPYTKDEVCEMLVEHFRQMAMYWARLPNKTPQERCDGLAFSILAAIDGQSGSLPAAFSLVPDPHPEDMAYAIENGENWFEPAVAINADVMLHDMYYRPEVKNDPQS